MNEQHPLVTPLALIMAALTFIAFQAWSIASSLAILAGRP